VGAAAATIGTVLMRSGADPDEYEATTTATSGAAAASQDETSIKLLLWAAGVGIRLGF
jgi:hypothetical protein